MAGISNINSPMQYTAGKTVRKLSFEIGEVFSARIVDENIDKGEAIIKLNNGWKFSAKLTSDINYDSNIFNKFIVDGYEDGKIKIKILQPNNENNVKANNTSESILKQYAANKDNTADYSILKSLLDHNIPLTKENILNVRSVMKFKDNIIENAGKEEEFINQYMKSNNIEQNSNEGKEVRKSLKKFFKELKSFTPEEFAAFIENKIEINGDNINSFNRVFKGDFTIYRELKNMKAEINPDNLTEKNLNFLEKGNTIELSNKVSDSSLNKILDKKEVSNTSYNSLSKSIDNNLNKIIISEINSKINDMKDIIRELINKVNLNEENFENILNTLGSNINDIKLFNLISEGYYYLDVPINLKNKNYNCKLIIKDDRKSGKKIDSKSVKLIASIKTVNMGVIDTFINVNNNNLNVDIKSEEKWIKLLELAKDRLSNRIKDMGYIVNLKVKPKESEVNIVSCRSFFNNEYTNNLDRRV